MKSLFGSASCFVGKALSLLLSTVIMLISADFTSMSAQSKKTTEVIGVVVDENDEPMPGVSVYTEDKSTGTISGEDGRYAVIIDAGITSLYFSFLGYQDQVVDIRNATLVKMQPDENAIAETVVTGIYERKAESFTGASAAGSFKTTRVSPPSNVSSVYAALITLRNIRSTPIEVSITYGV